MQRGTRRRPEERRSHARKGSGESFQDVEDDARVPTESQDLRYAARAFDESSATDDAFFAQFKETVQADKNELLKAIRTKQQDAINADAAFLSKIRGPLAHALRPRDPSAQRSSSQQAGVKAPTSPACPMAATGARILQLSKQLLASYEEAKNVVDIDGDGDDGSTKGAAVAAGRLGDGWPADVEKLRSLLEVGYRKAQDDVARVLQGHGGDGGGSGKEAEDDGADTGEAKTREEELDAFFGSGRDKQGERERLNVTQALCEASRAVRRLSKSLPPETEE